MVEHFFGHEAGQVFSKKIFLILWAWRTQAFLVPKKKIDRLASLYEQHPKKGPVFWVYPGGAKTARVKKRKMLSGGGGLLSTMSDYYRFCSMLLNQGELDGTRIIGRKGTCHDGFKNPLPDNKDLTEMSQSAFSETTYQGVGFLGFGFFRDTGSS
ncbi:MAG: hypothetical protein CM1200mP12_00970 [Gammaproteobacteria bacterium]|nr:MAG: hypothetical protein CM1200mP12_00970 [Gammaproteobacteria bacterium]